MAMVVRFVVAFLLVTANAHGATAAATHRDVPAAHASGDRVEDLLLDVDLELTDLISYMDTHKSRSSQLSLEEDGIFTADAVLKAADGLGGMHFDNLDGEHMELLAELAHKFHITETTTDIVNEAIDNDEESSGARVVDTKLVKKAVFGLFTILYTTFGAKPALELVRFIFTGATHAVSTAGLHVIAGGLAAGVSWVTSVIGVYINTDKSKGETFNSNFWNWGTSKALLTDTVKGFFSGLNPVLHAALAGTGMLTAAAHLYHSIPAKWTPADYEKLAITEGTGIPRDLSAVCHNKFAYGYLGCPDMKCPTLSDCVKTAKRNADGADFSLEGPAWINCLKACVEFEYHGNGKTSYINANLVARLYWLVEKSNKLLEITGAYQGAMLARGEVHVDVAEDTSLTPLSG